MKWKPTMAILALSSWILLSILHGAPIVHGKEIGPGQEIQTGVWRVTDSPIYVNVDVVVPVDQMLRIEAGVTVYFEQDKEMLVRGELVADGTASSRISFVYRGGGTGRAHWKGIRLQSVTQPSIMSYCIISNARNALVIEGSLNNIITSNIIRYNTAGILVEAAQGNIISGNEIYENTDWGISVKRGCQRIVIFGNAIYKIQGDGIVLGGGPPFNIDVKIRDNTIQDNYGAGINASFTEAMDIASNLIYHNWKFPPSNWRLFGGNILLTNTSHIGRLEYFNKDITIYNNRIHSAVQNGSGIYIGNATNVRITYNDIHLNEGPGVNATGGSRLCQVHNNNLRNNGYSRQAWDGGTSNYWDDGSRGNYWSSYKGNDTNNDGVGDTPYDLGGPKNSKDHFPLANPLLFLVTTVSTSATSTRMAILTSYLSTTTMTDTSPTLATVTSYATWTSHTWTVSTTSTITVYSVLPTTTSTTTTTSSTSTWLTTVSSTSSVTTTVTTTLTAATTPGRCFIASAAYGSDLSPAVHFLRDFRERQVLTTFAGSRFMRVFNAFYYSFSPALAEAISSSDAARSAVRTMIAPLLMSLQFGQALSSISQSQSELLVAVAGLASSAMIGLMYGLPFMALVAVKAGGEKKKRGLSLKPLALVWLGSLVALGIAEAGYFYLGETPTVGIIAMISTGTLVLSTMILAPLLLLKLIRRFIR